VWMLSGNDREVGSGHRPECDRLLCFSPGCLPRCAVGHSQSAFMTSTSIPQRIRLQR
jgi:hypothetical protein